MNPKRKAVLDRIKHLEEAITKGREYLQTGGHAHWHGFRPLFVGKVKDSKTLPPHKDWVKNVFLPHREKLLRKAHKSLERLTLVGKRPANKSLQRTTGKPAVAEFQRYVSR